MKYHKCVFDDNTGYIVCQVMVPLKERKEVSVGPKKRCDLECLIENCFDLVPLPSLREAPSVRQFDGSGVIHISGVWTNTRKSNALKFELILAFDEAISLGLKENLTIAQVKQCGEMESDEGKLHKLNRGEKGGFMSLQSMGSGRIESSFSDMSISSSGGGFFSGSGFGHPPSSGTAPPKGLGMQLGQSRLAAPPPNDPITLTVEEKLNVTLKRDGGMGNFDVQGTLSLQIIETGGNPAILFNIYPNMNKELHQ
ncbi:hypothetical protein Pint_12161 [Pistacia integerrima]|uniref:Uncharacterized protein n=1 Tax=Pistacia integerrima TaxID=434235 RepID=A0ACC0XJF1_9ROSI|nr:hypothetical protein Pint_12161 [Pistacia integerrima]